MDLSTIDPLPSLPIITHPENFSSLIITLKLQWEQFRGKLLAWALLHMSLMEVSISNMYCPSFKDFLLQYHPESSTPEI